jgi:hypothetical protein
MSKTLIIKLTTAGNRTGPFNIIDNLGTTLGTNLSKQNLIDGYSVVVNNAVTSIIISSVGKCRTFINVPITNMTIEEIADVVYQPSNTASIWRHLTNPLIYNKFYDNVEPYIIEYPFAYQANDEILQSVKDYTKAYKYLPIADGVFNDNAKIEVDDKWFNKAILYNGQQSSGMIELVPKPVNNLKEYMKYPLYNVDSKTIVFTKSDNFYQYNTFWSLVKDKSVPLFEVSCDSLSVDKVINQTNMDYGKRSYKKEPLRAKDLKVRHILDDKSDVHLTSQFIVTPSQISYK